MLHDNNPVVSTKAYNVLFPVFVDWCSQCTVDLNGAKSNALIDLFLFNLINKVLGLVAVCWYSAMLLMHF